MSDKPISAGDLVQVIRPAPCCGHSKGIGLPFVVSFVAAVDAVCTVCGHIFYQLPLAYRDPEACCPVSRLKRLDPDNLKDDVPTGEELTV